jgi:gas vesicle protein
MKTSKVLLGVIAGAGIGALLGMLYAPEKGSKMRRNLKYKKDDITDSLRDKFEEFVDVYTKKYEKAIKGAKDVIGDGKTKYNEMSKELETEIGK